MGNLNFTPWILFSLELLIREIQFSSSCIGWSQLSRRHTGSEVQTCVSLVSVFCESPLKAVMHGMRAFEALVPPLRLNWSQTVPWGPGRAVEGIIPLHSGPPPSPNCLVVPAAASELGPRWKHSAQNPCRLLTPEGCCLALHSLQCEGCGCHGQGTQTMEPRCPGSCPPF